MPHAQEKCITGAKVCGVPKFAERTDSYRDGDLEESSLNYAASVALPCLRLRARFAAHKKYCCTMSLTMLFVYLQDDSDGLIPSLEKAAMPDFFHASHRRVVLQQERN